MYISFGTGNPGTDGDKLLDRSVHLKVLSIMTITRERQSDHSGREAHRRGHHVVVNDPTAGYGIYIQNMLDAAA